MKTEAAGVSVFIRHHGVISKKTIIWMSHIFVLFSNAVGKVSTDHNALNQENWTGMKLNDGIPHNFP
jgi:hypothetical protein